MRKSLRVKENPMLKTPPWGKERGLGRSPQTQGFAQQVPASWFSRSGQLYIPHRMAGAADTGRRVNLAPWELHMGKVTLMGPPRGPGLPRRGWSLNQPWSTSPIWMKE